MEDSVIRYIQLTGSQNSISASRNIIDSFSFSTKLSKVCSHGLLFLQVICVEENHENSLLLHMGRQN